MARRKKHIDDAAGTDDAPGEGHNGGPPELTEEQKQALALQWKKKFVTATGDKDAAVAVLRNMRKQIKAELGDDGVDLVKDMIALESEQGEARIKAAMERQLRAAHYMAAPLGAQFDMFPDRQPAEDRARAEGMRDAMSGQSLQNPYGQGKQHDAYAEGWHAGEKARIEAQRRADGTAFDAALSEVEAKGIAGAAADVIGDQPATYEEAAE